MALPVSWFCAHRTAREQVSPKPLLPENLARDVRRLGFWERLRDCSFFFSVTSSASSSSWRRGRHCDPLPAPTVIHYFKQLTDSTMGSTSENGASNALGMGPSSGYTLNSSSCINILIFMLCTISVEYNMPWMYVFIFIYVMFMTCALSGTFYITWLCVFDHAFSSYMFYDFAGIYLLSCFDAYNHVDHAHGFRMNIYDAMMLLLIFSYDIIMIQLFFWIKLTWQLSKYLTTTWSFTTEPWFSLPSHVRLWPCLVMLKNKLKYCSGWFSVREKHYSSWKNKLKSTDYKPAKQDLCHVSYAISSSNPSLIEHFHHMYLSSIASISYSC
jgi:hypothetical protein